MQRMAGNTWQLTGRNALLTGGGGVLGAVFARALAEAGARVWVSDLVRERAERVVSRLRDDGLEAEALELNVTDRAALERAAPRAPRWDILLNGAGGNLSAATTSGACAFFDLPRDALAQTMELNFLGGAVLPAQVFGKAMAKNPQGGVILNVSSMNAFRPLTRIPAYSAAKAAVSNFTQWLAVHLAQEYNPRIRVNALAPGFFLTEQNRYLLTGDQGALSERGRTIVQHTPMGRFGDPRELAGAVQWLCSDAASFVTGIVVPIDGGFSAFSGV
jgi:NAD(P)-dependent dehydrogenase (short-subunit alcohol dehydrogenase family)